MIGLLLLLLATPNPVLTPGVVRPLNGGEVCGTRWGLDRRFVDEAMKARIAAAYHIVWPVKRRGVRLTPAERALRAKWEMDHLVPRELAGSDDERNVWPQPIAEAHAKDVIENQLHRAVCAGLITLADAQEQMRRWGQ